MRTIDICRDAQGVLLVRSRFDNHPLTREYREGEEFELMDYPGKDTNWPWMYGYSEGRFVAMVAPADPPLCERCGAKLRPLRDGTEGCDACIDRYLEAMSAQHV